MSYETILHALDAGVATITLNRPEVMNGLNAQMRLEITHAFTHLPQDARVVVLTGAGRAFCSGQDLGDRATAFDRDVERTLREEYEPMLRAVYDCPLPTIAAVNGAAAGAGASLALATDVVIAAQSAVFVQAFARIGLIPDAGGTYWLPRQVGFAKAMGAALFAERITAAQADAWGMIWEAVPDDVFAATVQSRAAQLAQGPRRELPADQGGVAGELRQFTHRSARPGGPPAGRGQPHPRLPGRCHGFPRKARPPATRAGEAAAWAGASPTGSRARRGRTTPRRCRRSQHSSRMNRPPVRALLTGAAGCSTYLAGLMEREADWLRAALATPPEASLAAILAEAGDDDLAALPAALRIAKRRTALLVALADLGGAWDLAEVTGALTRLADRAVEAALTALVAAEIARGKLPGVTEADIADAAGMFVLAMGKMGAGELNYSSDIDLIVLFDESRHDPEDYAELRRGFIRVTQQLVETALRGHRRGLCLPHRPAPAPRPFRHPGLHRHRTRGTLLRKPRADLGARRLYQGAALRRGDPGRRGVPRPPPPLRLAPPPRLCRDPGRP